MPSYARGARAAPSGSPWNSLEFKLPLLMTGVLVTVLTIALAVTYGTLARTALSAAAEQVRRATTGFATQGAANIALQRNRYLRAARDSAIRAALRSTGDSGPHGLPLPSPLRNAVNQSLERLSMPADSGMPVELWTADGRRIAWIGNDVRGTELLSAGARPELPEPTNPAVVAGATPTSDSLRVGPLYRKDDRVHFWLVMPVLEGKRVLGYIAHQRVIARNPAMDRTLRALTGDSISIYYRNLDGKFWATVSGLPVDASPASAPERRVRQSELLFHEERIAGTPLVIWMDLPRSAVLAHPRRVARTLALLSLLLVLGGALASWAIGRRIARPLAIMTRAASAIAEGNYAARVPAVGEAEVRRLATNFNNMAEEVERSRRALQLQTAEAHSANNAKSEFLAIMSHELRTPLNAIGGYVDLMEMGLRGPVSPEQRRDLERIKMSQQHLLGLISGVLDLSRIESGRVTYNSEPVALYPFLSSVDALVGPQASAKSLTLRCEPCDRDLTVFVDREKLRQIMLNLLSNAIRHTPPHGMITMSVEGRGDMAAIIVEDTGPGIPPEKHLEVFEPFVQLDRSLTQMREGLGLGLAISRDLARGMGGDLVVEERDAPGACFVLTIPRAAESALASWKATGEMQAHRRHS